MIVNENKTWDELMLAQAAGKQLQMKLVVDGKTIYIDKVANTYVKPIFKAEQWRIKPDKMSAGEALYGFAAWLTCRDEPVIASSHHDSGVWAKLVDEFIKANDLDQPTGRWEKKLTHPVEQKSEKA